MTRPSIAKNAKNAELLNIEGQEVTITHPTRILWPENGYTKMDLVNYYLKVAQVLLPHIKDRPLTLKPYAEGIHGPSFYTHTLPKGAPTWFRTFAYHPVTEPNKIVQAPLVDNSAGLAWLANRAAIEVHPWLSTTKQVDKPDLIVFDLDPGKKTLFAQTLEVAEILREYLDSMKLKCWPKTSGGAGTHVYVPIEPSHTYEQTRQFAERVAKTLASRHPETITATLADPHIETKVHVDYAQNSIGRTTASVYSVRPRPGAPVSTPLTWDEVKRARATPADFTIITVPPRIAKVGDLFQPVRQLRQKLPIE